MENVSHKASNARGFTAGKMGRKSSHHSIAVIACISYYTS